MRVNEKYFLVQFLKYFAVLTLGMSFFFASIDFIDHIHLLLPHDPGILTLVSYYFLIVPKYIVYLLPMSTLICAILTISLASKRKEIIAIKALGGDIRRTLYPFLVLALFISLVDFGFGEYVVPDSNARMKDIEYRLSEDRKRVRLEQGNIWLKGRGDVILHADMYIQSRKELRNVNAFEVKDSRPVSVVEADVAVWADSVWSLLNARRYDFGARKITDADRVEIGNVSGPEVLERGVAAPEDMGIARLLEYRRNLIDSGYRNNKLDIDVFSRVTYPLACVFMMLIGLSISLTGGIQSGILGVAAGVIISLIYWFLYTFMLSLGYAGVIFPAMAVSIAPVIFTALSIVMVVRIPR